MTNNLDDDVTFNEETTPDEYSFEATAGEMEGWNIGYYFTYGPQFSCVFKRYIEFADHLTNRNCVAA